MITKRIASYPVLLAALSCQVATAAAIPEEMAALRSQVSAWFQAADPNNTAARVQPPFSFTYDGKPSADLLTKWAATHQTRRLDEQRLEHLATYTHSETGLVVTCTAIEYNDLPAVDWMLEFRNQGNANTPIIENIKALDVQLNDSAGKVCTLHYSYGERNSAESFAPIEKVLQPEDDQPMLLAAAGGRSSDGYMPFFNVQSPTGGQAIAVGWSGQWEARFQRTDQGALHIQAGQQLTHLTLHPGEAIRTPRILLARWQGTDAIRGNNLIRQALLAHYLPRRNGKPVYSPICASVNWTAPDGTYEGPHLEVLPALAERGIEVFWSDMDPQQWYPIGFPNGTGTWEPDPAKYPRGLKPIGDAVRAAGMEYLLWFEPERVHGGSRIDKEHPEWVMKPAGEWSQLFALHDPAARRWLTDYIDVQITQARLGWVRWDFNIEPLGFWRRQDPPDRQGITEIRHVEGLYAMWDELRSRHPGLVIDNCASGGRRIDLESCKRGLPLWHSDMQCSGKPSLAADQLQNAGLFRWIPMHGCGNFAYEPSYAFRSAMTAGNILAPSNAKGRVSTADADTAETVKRTVAIYHKVRPYMLGDFYPLFSHDASEKVWFGYQFHRADLGTGMAILFRREQADKTATVHLRGADPQKKYEVSFEDTPTTRQMSGGELSALSVEIDSAPGSAIVYYRPVHLENQK